MTERNLGWCFDRVQIMYSPTERRMPAIT